MVAGPGLQSIVLLIGSTVHAVAVRPAVEGKSVADLGGDIGRPLGLAASGGGRVMVVFETADEKRSSAAVLTALSRHLDGSDRKDALDRATRLLKQCVGETKSARDAFLLAQLYRAGGDRAASVGVLPQQ